MRRITRISILPLAAFVAACGSDDPSNPVDAPATARQNELSVTLVEDLPADPGKTGQFTYFSLRQNAVVDPADSNTTRWDLALSGTTLLTNGSSSGPGQGGAAVLEGVDFESLAEVSVDQIRADAAGAPAIPGSSWYTYTGAEGNPPHAILAKPGAVLVVRTADSRYAKLQVLSYYKGGAPVPAEGDEARYYTFRYVFQPDGSSHF